MTALLASQPAFAAPAADAAAAVPNPGNNAWMMTATVLVLLMMLSGAGSLGFVSLGLRIAGTLHTRTLTLTSQIPRGAPPHAQTMHSLE